MLINGFTASASSTVSPTLVTYSSMSGDKCVLQINYTQTRSLKGNIMKPFTHCSYCGARFPEGDTWPKICTACTKMTWRNPTPVAVLLIPVDGKLVGIRRQNTVQSGHIAPPGGFVMLGETWQEAAARETKEETNIDVHPDSIITHSVVSTPDGVILIFGLAPIMTLGDLPPFIPNHEASERMLIAKSTRLAFPIHTDVVKKYFSSIKQHN